MVQSVSQSNELARMREQLEAALRDLDASERLRAQAVERERILAAELQHRVRNLLALLRSVFARTIDTAESVEEAAGHFPGRLDAIARHHGQIIRERAVTVDLEGMVRDELLNFGVGDSDQIALSGPAVRLPHQQAELIGLALHELATNSVKFGALAGNKGRLDIRWSLLGKAADPRLAFEWIEAGVPVVGAAPLRSGFGREFIEQALPYQIDAVTSFELRPGGVACHIELPLKRTAGQEGEERP